LADVEFDYGLARFISFRDLEVCERVRRISRAELTNHPNPDFRMSIVDDRAAFYRRFAEDLVGRIRTARDEGARSSPSCPWARCRSTRSRRG
jgi:glucosamine-6-phosphate deaminase